MQIKVSSLTHHPQNEEIYNLSNIDDLVDSDKSYGLSAVHVFTRSLLLDDQPIRHDGKAKAGMLVLAWYVFTNGYSGHPALSWIDNGSQIH